MSKPLFTSETKARDDLEPMMQKVSLVASLASLSLMMTGLVDMLADGAPLSIPGLSAPSPLMVVPRSGIPASLVAMSAGIVLLALLPVVRVLLAFRLYVRHREVLNSLAALIVFLELLLSMRTGG